MQVRQVPWRRRARGLVGHRGWPRTPAPPGAGLRLWGPCCKQQVPPPPPPPRVPQEIVETYVQLWPRQSTLSKDPAQQFGLWWEAMRKARLTTSAELWGDGTPDPG